MAAEGIVPAMDNLPDHIRAQALSPFHGLLGIEMQHWEEGLARLLCMPGAQHANRSGIVHGGVMLALLDQVIARRPAASGTRSRSTSTRASPARASWAKS